MRRSRSGDTVSFICLVSGLASATVAAGMFRWTPDGWLQCVAMILVCWITFELEGWFR